ncbi:MAG: DUF2064 domain-containing protein [Bdellovibrionota bacterium]
MQTTPDLSIIIPVGAGETALPALLARLPLADTRLEIIVAATSAPPESFVPTDSLRWMTLPKGRARQMNLAAQSARGRFLWFLHADSSISDTHLNEVRRAVADDRDALHYFKLRFRGDGPRLMKLNAGAANLRSRYLGMPFGDQAFLIKRNLFWELGGYDEKATYGEDHLLAWATRRSGHPLVELPEFIETSARKYHRSGWLKTTGLHLKMTYAQALPEFLKLVAGKAPEKTPAVACFVKTPGLSPIKSRLAKTIGEGGALEVYRGCVERLRQELGDLPEKGITPYWAVAESGGLANAMWNDFSIVSQGEGSLGERLGTVYEHLLAKHSAVVFIGADCPLVDAESIATAVGRLGPSTPYALGPTSDGGYYLFAGARPVEPSAWLDVPYSAENTHAVFKSLLEKSGTVAALPPLFDIDEREDLEKMVEVLRDQEAPLAALARNFETILSRARPSASVLQ